MEYNYKQYIIKWKNKEEDGNSGKCEISEYIRRYLFDKFDNKCQQCGWGEINIFTKRVPLQIHHVDGDCTNNIDENNLELLCPNCHSLTGTFGNRNKNSKRTYRINGVLG